MTKQEAIEAMRSGKRVAHRYFSPGEWITMWSDGKIKSEDGVVISEKEFWGIREGGLAWEDDWELVPEIENKVKR